MARPHVERIAGLVRRALQAGRMTTHSARAALAQHQGVERLSAAIVPDQREALRIGLVDGEPRQPVRRRVRVEIGHRHVRCRIAVGARRCHAFDHCCHCAALVRRLKPR